MVYKKGNRIDKYEIEDQLGEGGMGVVYRARDPVLKRDVALKVIRHEAASAVQPAAIGRFLREAQALAQFNHPNVVTIYDSGTDQAGLPYIVMELLVGQSLRNAMRNPMTLSTKLSIILQVLHGLAMVHAESIIHRDLKPDNIFLINSSVGVTVKITDFGLARRLHETPITASGAILGTPDYMSPEQAKGRSIDRRSDLFSVGSVLFELIVGSRPFQAEEPLAILRKISESEPDFRKLEVAELKQVLVKALKKDPRERYQSATEFIHALEKCQAAAGRPLTTTLSFHDHTPNWLGRHFRSLSNWIRSQPDRLEKLMVGLLLLAVPVVSSIVWRGWLTVRSTAAPAVRPTAHTGPPVAPLGDAEQASPRPSGPNPSAVIPRMRAGGDRSEPVRPSPMRGPIATGVPLARDESVPSPQRSSLAAAAADSVEATPPASSPSPPPSPAVEGWLFLSILPPVRVTVDGVRVGVTPLRLALPPGEHKVELCHPEFEKQTRRVFVEQGKTKSVNVDLKRQAPRRSAAEPVECQE